MEILTALKVFKEMKEEGFKFIACINADYSTPYHEKMKIDIYTLVP